MNQLHDLVLQLHKQTGITNPRELAEKVFADLSRSDYPDALAEALPVFCYGVIQEQGSLGEDEAEDDTEDEEEDSGRKRRKKSRSARGDAIRQRYLDMPLCGVDGWKTIGESTAEDLMFGAGQRREAARKNLAKADWLERVAEILEEHGKTKVRQLPRSVHWWEQP